MCKVWIVLLTISPVLAGYVGDKSSGIQLQSPQFDDIIKEIDAHIAETVLLPCTVRNLGDKVVSWIRTRDLSILTSGTFTFSADNRFESVHSSQADFWGLLIRGVKITDTGQYECQVNTDPKMSLAVNLSVADNKQPAGMSFKYTKIAKITSPKEVYVRAGSPLILTCEIIPAGEEVQNHFHRTKGRVRWLYEETELTSESDRGGISVDTDYRDRKITSRLKVSMVTSLEGGTYTCTQEGALRDSIKIHVFDGEHSEAMQRDAAYSRSSTTTFNTLSLIIYLLLYIT